MEHFFTWVNYRLENLRPVHGHFPPGDWLIPDEMLGLQWIYRMECLLFNDCLLFNRFSGSQSPCIRSSQSCSCIHSLVYKYSSCLILMLAEKDPSSSRDISPTDHRSSPGKRIAVVHQAPQVPTLTKTRRDETRQDKTRRDKTRQDKIRHKTRQDQSRQYKTRQDKTRQDKR